MATRHTNRTTPNGKKRALKQEPGRGEKLSPAGARIVSAFEEAIGAMRTGEPLEGRLTVRTYHAEFARPAYGPDDVRRVRGLLGMSQVVFARFLGVEPNTIRSWEQGSRPPSPIARRFMGEIEADPAYWRKRIAKRVAELF
jgi:DNA-binding transcriptional regulator YiaG